MPPPLGDRELVLACQAGDPQAETELVRRHQAELLRTVGRIVGRWSVAEELVQEAFLRAFERIDQIDPARGARAYLYRIAINLARHHLRDRPNAEEASEIGDDERPLFVDPPCDPEEATALLEDARRVQRALEALPLALREILVLRYVEALPFTEISRILDTRIPGLRMRALRARRRLEQALEEMEP